MPIFSKLKVGLLIISITGIIANVIFVPVLPTIAESFADNPNASFYSKLIIVVPLLAIILLSPISGLIIDRLGRIPVLITALIFYTIGGGLGYFMDSLEALLATRLVLGVGVAGIINVGNTLSADYFEGKERQTFFGLRAGFVAFNGIMFVVIGGLISKYLGWQNLFFVYLVGLVIIPLVLVLLKEPELKTVREKPFLDKIKSIKNKRYFIYIFSTASISMLIFYVLPTQIPEFLEKEYNVDALQRAIPIAIATICTAIASISYIKLKDKIDFSSVYIYAFTLIGIGFSVIYASTSYFTVLVAMGICGFGVGFMMPNAALWLFKYAPVENRGFLSGLLNTSVFAGQFVSPFLIEWFVLPYCNIRTAFLILAITIPFVGLAILFLDKYMIRRLSL